MRRSLSASLVSCVLFGLACGRTEPFQTESYGPGTGAADDPDAGPSPDLGVREDAAPPTDAGPEDAGFDGDSRPNFPDVGSPDLGCGGCDEIRAILEDIRWQSPCLEGLSEELCTSPGPRRTIYHLRGLPGAQYEAVLRFRGVAELRTYLGGYHEGRPWLIGGSPTANARNIFQLEFSSPAETIQLNRVDEQRDFCHRLDYQLAVRFNVGSSIVATIQSRGRQLRNLGQNGRPITVGGVPEVPQPYDGQFIELSVQSIRRIR